MTVLPKVLPRKTVSAVPVYAWVTVLEKPGAEVGGAVGEGVAVGALVGTGVGGGPPPVPVPPPPPPPPQPTASAASTSSAKRNRPPKGTLLTTGSFSAWGLR